MRKLRVLRIAFPCLSIGMLLTAAAFDGWREVLWDNLSEIRSESFGWNAVLDAAQEVAQRAIDEGDKENPYLKLPEDDPYLQFLERAPGLRADDAYLTDERSESVKGTMTDSEFEQVLTRLNDRRRAAVSNKERAVRAAETQIQLAAAGVRISVVGAVGFGALSILLVMPLMWGFLARAYRPIAVGIVRAARGGWRGSVRHVRGIIDEAKQRESER